MKKIIIVLLSVILVFIIGCAKQESQKIKDSKLFNEFKVLNLKEVPHEENGYSNDQIVYVKFKNISNKLKPLYISTTPIKTEYDELLVEGIITSVYQIQSGNFKFSINSKEYTVEFDDPYGYLLKCEQEKCSSVFFDLDSSGKIQKVIDKDNYSTTGIINDLIVYNESIEGIYEPYVIYTINYEFESKKYNSLYREDLCRYYQGGGKQCFKPGNIGDPIVLRVTPNNSSIIDVIWIFEKIQEAEVIGLYPSIPILDISYKN